MKEKIALLCPVPCAHMDDAIATCRGKGRVAFGSQVEAMFYDAKTKAQRLHKGLRVLIYVSQTGDAGGAARRHDAGRIAYEATYLQWTRADGQGKHPCPNVRPEKAHVTDTEVWGFWEVSNLTRLPKSLLLSDFRTDANGSIASVPRAPMFVRERGS